MADDINPVSSDGSLPVLQEHPLQSHLIQLIPAKAQKTLSTFDIEFTCIDSDGHYIAIGTNIGIVYLFDRLKNHLSRLRNENRDPVTCVKVLISLECLVVFGCKSGAVLMFKIPFDTQEIEKFTVDGLHNSPITALEWVKNGIKFFSGDESGVVVCTEIDHFEHQSKSRILLNDQSKIVQLSYNRLNLVISTLFRSIIYSCEDGSITKIGQKERKCYGPFGAIIFQMNNTSENMIFASRPGQRLWKSDKTGIIHETLIFKSSLSEPHPVIKLVDGNDENNCCQDFQFGKLLRFNEKYILVSSDSEIVLIDFDQKSIVASSPKIIPIVDVAASNDEIFILRGLRNIMRISFNPDPYPSEKAPEESSIMEDILVPLKELTTFVKERSDSLAAKKENIGVFDWLKKKRSSSSPAIVPDVVDHKESKKENNPEILPKVVQLQSEECMPIVIDSSHTVSPVEVPKINITAPLIGNESDDIVYKPKKKKKKVRFRSVSPKGKDKKSSNSDSKEENSAHNNKPTNESKQVLSDVSKDSSSNDQIVPNLDDTDSADSKLIDIISTNLPDSSKELPKLNISHSISSTDESLTSANSELDESSDKDCSGSTNSKIDESYDKDCADLTNSKCDESSNKDCVDSTNSSVEENTTACQDQQLNKDNKLLNDNFEKSIDLDDIYSSNDVSKNQDLKPKSVFIDTDLNEECVKCTDDLETLKYGVEWVEYKAPEVLTDLKVSNDHIFCVDIRNQIYFSNYPVLGLQWRRMDQPAEKIALSTSENIFWALYKGIVYAAKQKDDVKWRDVEWISVARDVVSISVDEDTGWYVTSTGHLTYQSNLSISQPFGYPKSFPFEQQPFLVQVSVWNKVVWLLSASGSLYTFKYEEKKSKQDIKKIKIDGISDVDSIFLGVQQTGWFVDSSGIIRLKVGVTPNSPEGKGKIWEVEASNYFIRDNANLPKAVLKALNNETLSTLIRGKQHICLSTSPSGIWFCKTLDNALYSNQKNIIGHNWESVIPPSTASATKWLLISAAGISCSQGPIWCMDSTGELFCMSFSTNSLIAVELPVIPGVQSIIPTPNSLWLLSQDGMVFIRRGITPNCPEGVWWQAMDLAQLGSEQIIDIGCSFEVSWACTNQGRTLVRLGTLCPSSQRKLPQAWIPLNIEPEEIASPIMEKVYVGPLGQPVWALDTKGNVYVREGVTSNMPIGKNWTLIPELQAKSLCISKSAVWLLKCSGKIFRRFGITEKNPCGDYWKQIPGVMDFLSVTEDDDLWGLKDNGMFQHSSFVLKFASDKKIKQAPIRSISEEDWEDIMIDTLDDEI
ncbi:hypothetical protein CDAR_482752 [Caerostris darwini]|uniref:HPS5-like beta-propeller domain-containing protein n=1 Tax=Caerostris darwini TaxID=1538125 RepID=A0AAV4WB74_9ARAC|nr:hypothetical protein CDAR_482752 [Caerostris darwini]